MDRFLNEEVRKTGVYPNREVIKNQCLIVTKGKLSKDEDLFIYTFLDMMIQGFERNISMERSLQSLYEKCECESEEKQSESESDIISENLKENKVKQKRE